tara:strand:+ start:140 stop:3949 length:3810 start_codon:yes stop_codon:yes gene_type:complete
MNDLIKIICSKIEKRKKDNIFIIGIDGPTASGKTTLADNIKKKIKDSEIFIFKLDWTLKERKFREDSLKDYKKTSSFFYYEAEEHMNLQIASNFLKKIKTLGSKKKINLTLNNLYDRDGSTKNNLTIKTTIKKKTIIIIEGHYTAYKGIYKYIDFNVLLLSKKNELIKRKINRVKTYRKPLDTRKYFDLIDIPSFVNYLSRFGNNYNLIFDNTNYNKPKKINHSDIGLWIDSVFSRKKSRNSNLLLKDLFNKINFYHSIKKDLISENDFNKIIELIFKLDNFIGKNVTSSINEIKSDINEETTRLIGKINLLLKGKKFDFIYTNNFHNLYHKKFPINMGFSFNSPKSTINITVNYNEKSLEIFMHWDGGVEKICIRRVISIRQDKNILKFDHHKQNIEKVNFLNSSIISNYVPTDFTSIDFFNKKFYFKNILTNSEESNISSTQIKEYFYENNKLWIRRFAKFNERDFFKKILDSMGADTFVINNYLFAFKSCSFESNKKFADFFETWKLNTTFSKQLIFNNKKYDEIIDHDRIKLKKIINIKTKSFKCLDGKIFFSPKKRIYKNLKILKKDIKFLLSHKKRIVRKSICNFVVANYSESFFNTKKLWPMDKDIIDKNITLSDFTKISPTILNDLYFWLNMKNSGKAILAANIYDIRKNSLDISAYLQASQESLIPMVLQSSFNAIGQKERYKKEIREGYLKLKNGPNEFVDNILLEARKIFLKNNNKDFLYGIGLDHVDFRYDQPKGRVYRFLDKFKNKNNITHYTLDSSYLLEDPKIKNFSKNKNKINKKVIKNEINLLKKIEDNHLFDFEFCANELNYIENEKKVYVPSKKDIEFFAKEFFEQIQKTNISYINSRPKLIIGNLGTVHHGYDNNNHVKSDASAEWISVIKKFNFVSAVLHGTSRSHPDVLKRATAGCFKINVAGDLLQVLVSNLPDNLKNMVTDKNDNEKKKLFLIKDKINKINRREYNKIYSALNYKCKDLMNLISSPSLSNNDVNYFKYRSYNISDKQCDYISSVLSRQILNFKEKKRRKNKKGTFLMSPIEIKYGEFFKKVVGLFIKKKLNIFHLDVGDGDFISRKLDVTKKLKYIKKLNTKHEVHLHLMVNNPHLKNFDNDDYITHYANLGADYIGLHRRTFKNIDEMELAIIKIISLKKKPGIFLEIDEDFDYDLSNLVFKHNIKWIVFMGVPIGYGGQFFNKSIIPKIKNTINFLKKNNHKVKIEVDGGLTTEVIDQLNDVGVDYYAGWSIVKGGNLNEISLNLENLKKYLK